MLKLLVENTTSSEAVVPVTWCVDHLLLEEIKSSEEIIRPYILIVVGRGDEEQFVEEDSYVLPLEQMMHYLRFNRSGPHRVRAAVVWTRDDDGYIGRFYKGATWGDYVGLRTEFEFTYYTGTCKQTGWARRVIGSETEITVNVADGFFAKEPPRWEWRWVNFWFDTEPRDQCQYRKRRFVAYTIQPIALAIYLPVLLLIRTAAAAFILLMGQRGVDLEPLIHPFSCETKWIWSGVKRGRGNDFFLYNKNWTKRHWAFRLLSPRYLLALFIGAILGWRFHHWILANIGAVAILVLGIVVIVLALYRALVGFKSTEDERWARKQAKEKEQIRRMKEEYLATLGILTCDKAHGPLTFATLPKEKRTFHLRYLDLKARVCKPFAHS